MNKRTLSILKIALSTFFAAIVFSITVYAWGDSDGGRPDYSLQEVNEGKLGDKITFNSISIKDSDYQWYKDHYGENMPEGFLTEEKNYVGAREDIGVNAGPKNVWNGNDITVEDGKTYIVRMCVHNNNPNGWDAVAENTRVRFSVPTNSARQVQVNGFITSSNASPTEYVDYVNFNSDTAFHLEYIPGSAFIENNGKVGGSQLDDSVINNTTGVLIGYDALDGRVPGNYQYLSYIGIEVKAVFDYEFYGENKVRIVGNEDKSWHDSVEAEIGDKIEFQFQYKNKSSETHSGVVIRNVLPESLQYIPGSTKVYNALHPDGFKVTIDDIINDGITIGNYAGYSSSDADDGANAYIRITAEVVEEGLNYGKNVLVDWGQAQAGAGKQIVLQDYATVYVIKVPEKTLTSLEIILIMLITLCLLLLAACFRKIYKLKHHK